MTAVGGPDRRAPPSTGDSRRRSASGWPGPGPPSTDYTRRQAIDNLATAAKAAEPPVRDVTGLNTDGAVPDARIIDRPAGFGRPPIDAGDDRRNRQAAAA